MAFAKVEEALEEKKGEVRLKGWIYRIRKLKTKIFIILRDSTGHIQCVIDKNTDSWRKANDLLVESSIIVKGDLEKDERAPENVELSVEKLEVVHKADKFPIHEDKSVSFLLDVRHLWIRSEKMKNILKVRDEVLHAGRKFFRENGFYEVTGPMFVGQAGEEGSTLFEVEYFDKKAYLSQTSQLHLEAAIFSLEKVFTMGPSFRAEKSFTPRHLTEYTHLEAEEAWCNLEETLKTQEKLIEYIAQKVYENCKKELEALGRDPTYLKEIQAPFERIEYTKIIEKLQEKGFDIEWGEDLGIREERSIMEDRKKPLFVINYPKEAKAFYMKEHPKDPEMILCDDLLVPEGVGEIIGGSERETDYNNLIRRIKKMGDNPEKYEWYLDLRKYGSVPHSGFGLGMERLIRWFCKLDHIRDAIPFPRTPNRIYP